MRNIDPPEYVYHEVDNVARAEIRRDTISPLQTQVSYFNHLGVPVTIVGRNGVPFTMASTKGKDFELVISITYRVARSILVDKDGIFRKYNATTPEGEVIRKAIEEMEDEPVLGTGEKKYTLEYKVTQEDLMQNGGVLYLGTLDLMVSVVEGDYRAVHPYSDAGSRYRIIEAELDVNNTERFGYSIYLVSNNGRVGDKFTNIGGNVYRIPSVKNHSLRDGVYLCSSSISRGDHKHGMPEYNRYSYEEGFEALGLYDTREEAETLGDVMSQRDKELKELQLEFKRVEHQHKVEKAEIEKELDTQKRHSDFLSMNRQREMDAISHERSLRQMYQKDHYEDRSYQRKDSSEFMKFLPALITGAVTIGTLLYTQSNK